MIKNLECLVEPLMLVHHMQARFFNSWITIMAEKLGKLIVWLPRETLLATLSTSFSEFPGTTCIIDCVETFLQRPLNLKYRVETYSNYKGHNTAKYLVGASPHGQIIFISRSYRGRASDKFIVNDSDLDIFVCNTVQCNAK